MTNDEQYDQIINHIYTIPDHLKLTCKSFVDALLYRDIKMPRVSHTDDSERYQVLFKWDDKGCSGLVGISEPDIVGYWVTDTNGSYGRSKLSVDDCMDQLRQTFIYELESV